MTLIINSARAAALLAAGTENYPIIAWDGIVPASAATMDGTLTVGSSEFNPFAGGTYSRWLATTAIGTVTLSTGFTSTSMDFAAIASHNAGTLGLGVAIERIGASRTNLVPRSQDFSAGWTSGLATLTAAAAQAPDRSVSAGELKEDGTTGFHWMISTTSIAFTSGTDYVVSAYVKRGAGARHFGLTFPSAIAGVDAAAGYNLATGVATVSTAGTNTSAGMDDAGGGWWRCWLSTRATITASANSTAFRMTDSATNGNKSYAGDGASSLYIWGAQIETGATPTEYLMTTTGAVTSGARAFLGWHWPTDDRPIGWYFDVRQSAGWRWRFTNVGALQSVAVGVAWVGQVMTMPRPFYQGYAPIIRPTEVELQSNVSAGGHLLGSSVVKRGSSLQMDFANIDPTFVRGDTFKGFMTHFNEGKGAFTAWRPTKYPDDLHYFWRDGPTIRPMNSGPKDLMSLSIAGRVHEP